jgi:hypothetical protein
MSLLVLSFLQLSMQGHRTQLKGNCNSGIINPELFGVSPAVLGGYKFNLESIFASINIFSHLCNDFFS